MSHVDRWFVLLLSCQRGVLFGLILPGDPGSPTVGCEYDYEMCMSVVLVVVSTSLRSYQLALQGCGIQDALRLSQHKWTLGYAIFEG
jgi:hypothetical protein